jgi:methyltransferase (TIGR00027 family)
MQKGQASRTAEIAAAVRAIHLLQDVPTVFDDPLALELTSPAWRRIAKSKPLRWILKHVVFRSQRPVAAQVLARSRYAEDLLEEAIAGGIGQYVVVGAGFDSFALRRRDLESSLRVFELDHPDTQRVKVERTLALGGELPANVEFVGIDFERQAVADGLTGSSYQPTLPAFFSWLGTTPYLSSAAILDTLRSIAVYAAPGSELVFDYLVPDEVLSASDRRVVQKLKRFTARRGEPLIGELHPSELETTLGSIGLELIENFSGADQMERYFAVRDDGLRPLPASYFAHARVPGGAT